MNESKTWFGLNGLLALAFLSLFTLTSQVDAAGSNNFRKLAPDFNKVCAIRAEFGNLAVALAARDEDGELLVSESDKMRIKEAQSSKYISLGTYCNIAKSERKLFLKEQIRNGAINEANGVASINSRNRNAALYICALGELHKLTDNHDLEKQTNQVQFGNDIFSCSVSWFTRLTVENLTSKDIGVLASVTGILASADAYRPIKSGAPWRDFNNRLDSEQKVRLVFGSYIKSQIKEVTESGRSPAAGISQWYTGFLNDLGRNHTSKEVYASYAPLGKRMKLSKNQFVALKAYLEDFESATAVLEENSAILDSVSMDLSRDLFNDCDDDIPSKCAIKFVAGSLCDPEVHGSVGEGTECTLPGFEETKHIGGLVDLPPYGDPGE